MWRDFLFQQLTVTMRRLPVVVYILMAAMGGAQRTWAQGPPVHTETAFVTGLNGAAFQRAVRVMRKSKLLRDGEEVLDPMDREVRVTAVPLMFPYELLSNRLIVAAAIPYFDSEDLFLVTPNDTFQKLKDTIKEGGKDIAVTGKVTREELQGHAGHPYLLSIEDFAIREGHQP